MKNGDMSAMPQATIDRTGSYPAYEASGGLTKREMFAMHAMTGLCNAHMHDGTWAHDAGILRAPEDK